MGLADGTRVLDERAIRCHLERVAMKTCTLLPMRGYFATSIGRKNAGPCVVDTVQD
jgi:hypothetical protein